MSYAGYIYCRDSDAGAQSIVDRLIQVRVLQVARTIQAVNSVVTTMTARLAGVAGQRLTRSVSERYGLPLTPLIPSGRRNAFAASE